jgi:hypothetical protein
MITRCHTESRWTSRLSACAARGWRAIPAAGRIIIALYLFAIGGDRLRQVFAAPMSAYRDIAGDWHKDATRDHDITDSAMCWWFPYAARTAISTWS